MSRRGFFQAFKWGVAASAMGAGAAGPALAQASGKITPGGDLYVNDRRVLLWENTRKEIREALEAGRLKAAILPTGSIEQHGEHLAMVCDIALSSLVAQQVALQLYPQVIVAPPCPIGYSPYWMARKGTMTIRKETLHAYISDVLRSLRAHGLRTVLILNGHGGNQGLIRASLAQWRKELGITLDGDSYWQGIDKAEGRQRLVTKSWPSHGAEFETSLMLAAYPERVRRFTMDEYDKAAARWNFESGFSPEVAEFVNLEARRIRGENANDRQRQEQALLASAETGQGLIALATRFFAERLKKMIAAARDGKPWPPAE
jgi:creatinine amidohydrolase/Fe(II)-dependent formamide hydrolase-like protein